MKGFFAIILAFVLLFSGCSFSAEPTPMSSSGPWESNSTETYEETESNQENWSDHPLLALLPLAPDGVIWENIIDSTAEEVFMCTADMDLTDVKSYAQMLVDVGFCLEQYSYSTVMNAGNTQEKEFFRFTARDESYNFVIVSYTLLPNRPENILGCTLYVWRSNNAWDPPAAAIKNNTVWESDAVRAIVPEPPTEYWSHSPGSDTVKLQYLSIDELRTYANELRAAGFVYKQYECWQGSDVYLFSAQNADGCTVEISHARLSALGPDGLSSDLTYKTSLVIRTPEKGSGSRWDDILPDYLPDPDAAVQDWSYSQFVLHDLINLYGLDYQGAKNYVQEMERRVDALGGKAWRSNSWVEDDEQQYLECEMMIGMPTGEADYRIWTWILIYDPTNTECPCTLVYHQ